MRGHAWKVSAPALGLALLVGAPGDVTAQLDHLPYQLKYDRGQTVQPIFDGWTRNADGTFDMHFGYLNRNYVEELHVPIGPDNRIEPGGPDQGQPTFFQVRSNRLIFSVSVPSDFGDQELIWTLDTQGETLTAIGWLDPQWEIVETEGGLSTGLGSDPGPVDPEQEPREPNEAPELSFPSTTFSVTLPSGLTLSAVVSDDGRPEPPPEDGRAAPQPLVGTQTRPPLLNPPENALELPVNIPQHERPRRIPPRGVVSVSYEVWRGPANIISEPYFAEAQNGAATSRITFAEPGEYRLRAWARDGELATDQFITVHVRP